MVATVGSLSPWNPCEGVFLRDAVPELNGAEAAASVTISAFLLLLFLGLGVPTELAFGLRLVIGAEGVEPEESCC